MLNKVALTGRMTKDPELRYLGNGTPVASFTLAVDRVFKNKDGNREADFINIRVWRKQAENVAQYTGKGSLVAVAGRIQTRNYENKEGKRVYITEVVADEVHFLSTNKSNRAEKEYEDKDLIPFDNEDELPF
ncbi:MAG TPA: single-stranded DNA-binding protein [Bacteroidales bacterium]|nr:single-stranded DNA-binding protein [Bacteroidales bacterium]